MPTATARFSATVGDGAIRSSNPYSATISCQSVSSALGASACTAAIAACSWYGPSGPLDSAELTSATPSAMADAIPRRPVLLGERDQPAALIRAREAAGVREQHERQQAGDLVVVGEEPVQHPRQPDRLVGELGPLQVARRTTPCSPR